MKYIFTKGNKFLLLLGFMLAFTSLAYAQNTVSGKITDENGEGIPGVNIQIKGTTVGTVTDIEGNFTIRYIDFQEFLKNFDGICVPNEICLTDDRDDSYEDVGLYVKLGRELVESLNEYRLNEQDKKVSLEKMYRLG